MRFLFYLTFVCLPFSSIAQRSGFFWPDGTPLITQVRNIKSCLDSLEMVCSHEQTYKNTIVFYHPLSDKPAFLLTDNQAEIPNALKSFSRAKYLDSYTFKSNVKDLMSAGQLDTTYSLWAMGKPSTQIYRGDTLNWTFKKFNLSIDFLEGGAVGFRIFNYDAAAKAGIFLSNFVMIGEEFKAGFSIFLHNISTKRIKYAWFTINAYNPVDDLVASKTARCIGPVEVSDVAAWEFDNLFYSRVIDYLVIDQLKVQFFDGTIKIYPRKEVSKLIYRDDHY